MADPVLHIKDSYYFEVPKFMAPAAYRSRKDFPPSWGKNDPQFQDWEFHEMYHALESRVTGLPDQETLHRQWKDWQHEGHANFAKPIDVYLQEAREAQLVDFAVWKKDKIDALKEIAEPGESQAALQKAERLTVLDYLGDESVAQSGRVPFADQAWFTKALEDGDTLRKWEAVTGKNYWAEYVSPGNEADSWSSDKIAAYNNHLSGKILIPQPFGELKNLYERESGVAISKFAIVEILVGLVMIAVFSWIATRLRSGGVPRGSFWNLMEIFLLFIRDQVARPAIGGHHEDHGDHGHEEDEETGPSGEHGRHVVAHAKPHEHHKHNPYEMADRFVPLLWTLFFFVLFCNLSGMIPWVGAPTGSFSVTLSLALVTFSVVVLAGMKEFGFLGFFVNQVPSMDLPWYMAIFLKPMIFLIEMLGLLIKHLVLSIRLLANMVAGHLVILAFLGMAFGAEAALKFSAPGVSGWQWYLAAAVSILGVTAINLLELMVAFLQAYIFTFLSALFIGAAVHKH